MQLLHFLSFYLFLSQFLPDLDKIFIKIQGKYRATYLPSQFGPKPIPTGPRTAVFSGLSLKNQKDQVHGPGKTGPSVLRGPQNRTFKHQLRVQPRIFTRQVYLFGFSALQSYGTLLFKAIYWILCSLSNPTHSCVFHKIIHPSSQYILALQPIPIDTLPSIHIHERGWYSKTLLRGLWKVSRSVFCPTHFLSIF